MNLREEEEDKNYAEDDEAQDEPTGPAIPCVGAIRASVVVEAVVVAARHAVSVVHRERCEEDRMWRRGRYTYLLYCRGRRIIIPWSLRVVAMLVAMKCQSGVCCSGRPAELA